MLKAGLIGCWNEKQNSKSYIYLPANKHSDFGLNLCSHNNLPCENCCFIGCSVNSRQKDI